MKVCGSLAMLLVVAGILSPGQSQEPVIYRPEGPGSALILQPQAAPGQLFAAPGTTPEASGIVGAGGQVGGQGVSGIGNVQIGFDYIRPLWTFRDFTLSVPVAFASNFALVGDTGHVDNNFGLAPRVEYNYYFTNLDFGIKASGTFLNLSGQLHRDLATAIGSGQLDATSNFTLITANIIEFRKHYEAADFTEKGHESCGWVDDLLLDLSIGTRYSSLEQNYTGSLTSVVSGVGTNSSTRFSSQSFTGIGLTGSANVALEIKTGWFLFWNTRASLLVGDNKRSSTLTVNLVGQPGLTSTINDSSTEFLPVVEIETGAQWQTPVSGKLLPANPNALFVLRAAFVGQYWPHVGPLSAGSTQAYRESDLFLVGANVMVGFSY
jgi:hypothetical protein